MNLGHDRFPQSSKWSTSLFGCGEDAATCCITCFLPCVTFGQIVKVIDDGRTPCIAVCCLYGASLMCYGHWLVSCIYREGLRGKFGLEAEPCNDCCVHFCCGPCALCQEHAELKHRGIDPSKGWAAILSSAPPAPPMPPTMTRSEAENLHALPAE